MKKPLFTLALVAALAGCSRSEPEAPPANDVLEGTPSPAPPSPIPSMAPSPSAAPSAAENASDALPPPEEVGANEQMLDDASATGMTARARRDDEGGEPDEAPADLGNREER